MKRSIIIMLCVICVFLFAGCGKKETLPVASFAKRAYSENADGTWQAEGHTYKYRLEIRGRMPNAAADTTFVYLSNRKEITFEQAWKASGYSSNSADYFDREDAVLVEVKTE